MNGSIMLFWLGAVGLSSIGTWLLLRGLFGHRRIASRTRRCPRCRYDMTGRPGEMTCAECGLTARHESQWYGGRRRFWVAGVGGVLVFASVATLSRPAAKEHGYLAMLPLSVQVQVWPTWLSVLQALGLKPESEITAVRMLQSSIGQATPDVRCAAWRRVVKLLRDTDPTTEMAEELGYFLNQAQFWPYPAGGNALRVSVDDVLFLLSYPEAFSVGAGVTTAYHAEAGREDELFAAIVAAAEGPFNTELDDVTWILVELDFRRGGSWVNEVLADSNNPRHRLVTNAVGRSVYAELWQGPQSYSLAYEGTPALDLLDHWTHHGNSKLRAHLGWSFAGQMLNQVTELDDAGHAIGFAPQFRPDERLIRVLRRVREAIYSESDEAGDMMLGWLERGRHYVHTPWLLRGVDDSVSDARLVRILDVIQAAMEGSTSLRHLPEARADVLAVVEDRDRSVAVRSLAAELLLEIDRRHPPALVEPTQAPAATLGHGETAQSE